MLYYSAVQSGADEFCYQDFGLNWSTYGIGLLYSVCCSKRNGALINPATRFFVDCGRLFREIDLCRSGLWRRLDHGGGWIWS
jgi:hypothetical protein